MYPKTIEKEIEKTLPKEDPKPPGTYPRRPPIPVDPRPIGYPICWATQLLFPRNMQILFAHTKGERDEEKAKQEQMELEWRRFREPDFRSL